jgi:hypothetical protein
VRTFGFPSGGYQLAMGKHMGGKLAEIDDYIFKIAYISLLFATAYIYKWMYLN